MILRALLTEQPLTRGDVVSQPSQFRVGYELVIIDRELAMGGGRSNMARFVITRYHDLSAERRHVANITKASVGPNHWHGLLSIVAGPDRGSAPSDIGVVIMADSETIQLAPLRGEPPLPELPVNPLYLLA